MKTLGRRPIQVSTFGMLVLVLAVAEGWGTEPTLARLSFWAPPERMAEFERAYRKQVVPILERHGLVASSERGRATVDSVFARLFKLKMPSQVKEKGEVLREDPIAVEIRRAQESGGAPHARTRKWVPQTCCTTLHRMASVRRR